MATAGEKKRLRPINIRVDDEMLEELRAHAKADGRPLANVIVKIWRDYLAAKQRER